MPRQTRTRTSGQEVLGFIAVLVLATTTGLAQNAQSANPRPASMAMAGADYASIRLNDPARLEPFIAEPLDFLFAFNDSDLEGAENGARTSPASSTVDSVQRGKVQPGADSLATLWKNYNAAVEHVSVWRNEDVRLLKPLTVDPDGAVEVVTATKYEITTPLYGDTWVTIVPEVQTICRRFTADVAMQLRELLGLPPDHEIPNIYVLRVKAADVFRPTPDPTPWTLCPCGNPTQRACNFPATVQCGNSFPNDVAVSHQQWIANTTLSLRRLPGGFPWTHLGYTYNWTPGADEYGASEYIVRKGAQVTVSPKLSPEEYCKP